ncbi:hypothetical protein CWE09_05870 [Aliidiomarina minuta]|uniref:Lipoprotein n=1 Tax=Aliidiomarina minuta TaxID=880057 RepID=A0A432W860_9GAMM|nr:hypothetical protein [Aliidiomarina minuta]RUO26242.1 hypothetical protein CWE09_05870 [Aliidiomarina minuta]
MKTSFYAGALLAAAFTVTACGPPDQEDPADPTPEQQPREAFRGDSEPTDLTDAERRSQEGTYPRAEEGMPGEREHQQLYEDITRYEHRTQADNPAQCEVMALGFNPAGGPERYIVYSTRDMDNEERYQLQANLDRYNQAERNMWSDQQATNEAQRTERPEVRLEDGHCVAYHG